MQSYQEEYIANLKEISALSIYQNPEGLAFENYYKRLMEYREEIIKKGRRNIQILRENLFPSLDRLIEVPEKEKQELLEFASNLMSGSKELDLGLFCQIHKAFLNLARLQKNRSEMIKELYWLGMCYYYLSSKLTGLEYKDYSKKYIYQMRLYFTEAAAYLKYYDEIDDSEIRGYILRSCANMSLGTFENVTDKIKLVKRTLMILQDKGYQEKAPDLPWDRYIYMTHRQMASSISHSTKNSMTPQNVADIMESVHIVYDEQVRAAKEKNEKISYRLLFSKFAVEYHCGLYSFDGFLTKLEELMDNTDPADFSEDNMYGIISLPAFYCQYLGNNREQIFRRREYIENLYKRILSYMEAVPDAANNSLLFLYLRQLSYTFLETENSISYKDFMQKLQILFMPSVYVHSWVVGKAAQTLSGIIAEEEPNFFDDIEEIRNITDTEDKIDYIKKFAMECGIFHDVGIINLIALHNNTQRQWFEEEYEMSHLHTVMGKVCLSERRSTRCYSDIALGHHSWYDGSRGYPGYYKRLECPYRQMVDVIGLIDWIDNVTDNTRLNNGVEKTFDEAVETAVSLEGKRFSPLLTARLRDKEITERLRAAYKEGRDEGYRNLYNAK
ncbi:MAG: hypothetical protein NC203_10790 [Firmicutes bacterium]|nr:hypothetical protein [[Eubacterium] siraeum]MCM1488840.1 hypothetical protein [Bacillota bacterium]